MLLLGLALQWEFLGPLLLSSFSERSEQPALTEVISRLDALERNVPEPGFSPRVPFRGG